MEEKSIKCTAIVLLLLTMVFGVLYFKLPDIRVWAVEQKEEKVTQEEYTEQETQMNNLAIKDNNLNENTKQLRLRLPEGVTADKIQLTNDYITQTLEIVIPHTDGSYFKNYPITGSSDKIQGLSYAQGKTHDIIEITMDQVYELDVEYDENFYYFDFIKPQEIYDKVVVIDAGHGGKDPGAEKQGIMEKDIDLAILLELKELFENSEENIGVYYTRTDDSNPSHAQRVGLANKSEADLFISIHNNSTKSGRMSNISGTEVMYSAAQEGEFSSEDLAKLCMEELVKNLGSRDRGLVDGESIYIVRQSKVPVALIEVGFMTNREELKLLNSEEYQEKAANAIYTAIMRALEEKGQ